MNQHLLYEAKNSEKLDIVLIRFKGVPADLLSNISNPFCWGRSTQLTFIPWDQCCLLPRPC